MKKKEIKKIKEQKETPVSDGDTRPDKQPEGEKPNRTFPFSEEPREKVTKERGADINTLEDYKDAK